MTAKGPLFERGATGTITTLPGEPVRSFGARISPCTKQRKKKRWSCEGPGASGIWLGITEENSEGNSETSIGEDPTCWQGFSGGNGVVTEGNI